MLAINQTSLLKCIQGLDVTELWRSGSYARCDSIPLNQAYLNHGEGYGRYDCLN